MTSAERVKKLNVATVNRALKILDKKLTTGASKRPKLKWPNPNNMTITYYALTNTYHTKQNDTHGIGATREEAIASCLESLASERNDIR